MIWTQLLKLKSILVIVSSLFFAEALALPANRAYYEIKIYRITSKQQEEKTEAFLKLAYVPALHRAGIAKVGVFTPIEKDTVYFGKRIFVFIPYSTFDQFSQLDAKLQHDQQFQTAGNEYLKSAFDAAPYERIETILIQAFVNHPQFEIPVLSGPVSERVYELRSYESATEKLYVNKVQMFNQGDEIGLFKRLGFNAVFYGEVLAGSRMPNLMYMTSFNSITARDEHWKAFSNDAQWKKLTAMPEYAHNVSKADIFLLHPTDYSDL
jgi:hypothetical protein